MIGKMVNVLKVSVNYLLGHEEPVNRNGTDNADLASQRRILGSVDEFTSQSSVKQDTVLDYLRSLFVCANASIIVATWSKCFKRSQSNINSITFASKKDTALQFYFRARPVS